MIMTVRFARVALAVIQVLLLAGFVLAISACSGSPTVPSQATPPTQKAPPVVVVPAGPTVTVPPGGSSFWVGIEPNPIVMSVGSEASIRIDGSFDWDDLVVRAEPPDAFRVQPWGISTINLQVLRRTSGRMIIEVYGSGNRYARAEAMISVP